jgi:YVTN family beta-propeller protein
VDNYSSIVRWQIARVFGNLGRGVHFLTIEVTGWKNAASSHHFVDIDALEVINAPEATCIPEPQTIIAVGGEPHGLTLDAGANRLYVANYADDTISIIDTSSNSVVDTLTDAGGTPNGVAYDPINDRLYVTNRMSNTVTVIDLASRQVLGTITVGDRPEGIAFNPVTADIYVANFGSNTVSIIYDTAVVATLQVGSEPSQIAVNPAMNRIYVTNHGDHSASVIDGTARMVIGTIGGLAMAPYGIAVDPALNRVYVADIDGARLELIDATTNRRLDALIAPANAALRMVGVNADTHFVYATQDEDDSYPTRWQLENVFIYAYKPDKGRLESTRGFAIGNDPEAGLAIDSGRNRVYVANRMDNTVAVLACPEMPGEGTSTPTATVSPTPMPTMTPAITPIGGNP